MKFLKLLFWICATVILAYFLTDFRIGGKTVKQNIDDFLHSDAGVHLKIRLKRFVEEDVMKWINSWEAEKKSDTSSPAGKEEKVVDQNTAKPQEEITREDSGKLQDIIEHNQGATK